MRQQPMLAFIGVLERRMNAALSIVSQPEISSRVLDPGILERVLGDLYRY